MYGLYFMSSNLCDVLRRFCAKKSASRSVSKPSRGSRRRHPSIATDRLFALIHGPPPRVHDASHLLAFVRTFIVMYRDIPCTPDSFCSVHSRVTWRRTSFFLLAAVTTRTPRRDEDAAATLETWALSALVLATLTRAASMTTRRAASTM